MTPILLFKMSSVPRHIISLHLATFSISRVLPSPDSHSWDPAVYSHQTSNFHLFTSLGG